jgi:hypothetical protein
VLGRTGERKGLRSAAERILELAEISASLKTSDHLRRHGGPKALSAVGDAYATLARTASGSTKDWEQARDWFDVSLRFWNQVRSSGATGGILDTGPLETERKRAAADAALRQRRRSAS